MVNAYRDMCAPAMARLYSCEIPLSPGDNSFVKFTEMLNEIYKRI